MTSSNYIGRYAPSPTGRLHLGNLRTALVCWLHARLRGGNLLLRIEDIDQSRAIDGASEQMQRDLEWLGLDWDQVTPAQSQRTERYQYALQQLQASELAYRCYCSRRVAQADAKAAGLDKSIYSGTCRQRQATSNHSMQHAWRLIVDRADKIIFNDAYAGTYRCDLARG